MECGYPSCLYRRCLSLIRQSYSWSYIGRRRAYQCSNVWAMLDQVDGTKFTTTQTLDAGLFQHNGNRLSRCPACYLSASRIMGWSGSCGDSGAEGQGVVALGDCLVPDKRPPVGVHVLIPVIAALMLLGYRCRGGPSIVSCRSIGFGSPWHRRRPISGAVGR